MRKQAFLTVALVCGLAAGMMSASDARAQSEESDPAPARGQFEAAPPPPPAKPFLVPDVPESLAEKAEVKNPWLTLKLGLIVLADYTAFTQDLDSLAQVGKQENDAEARAVRLAVRGTLGKAYKVSYVVAAEYKGFGNDPDVLWSFTDVTLTFPLGGPAAKLIVGRTKETFNYEMVGDSANLPQMERILSPFFVTRNVGLKLTQVIGEDQRMTASGGVFNDWWTKGESFKDSGTDVTARFTGLVWDRRDGKSFLHLGTSGRYAGADNNTLRYKGKPESNVTDNYLDTGDLPADHAWHLGLEALWNEGPVSVLAEYNRAWVSSPVTGNPSFFGYYVVASWVLTGETRPYDRTVGYARRVMPEGRWGAPELVARFSHVDTDDGPVQGGKLDKTYLGINWWATRRWKVGFGWGHTWLHRFGSTGVTDSFLTRLQWIY